MKVKVRYIEGDVKRESAVIQIGPEEMTVAEAIRFGHLILEKARAAEWETTWGPMGRWRMKR